MLKDYTQVAHRSFISIRSQRLLYYIKKQDLGFPGGAVVKNPPANAGDMGLSPGPEISHMLRSK